MYRKEPKIYPRHVKGRFASLRVLAVWVLLGLYYLVPWFNIGGYQAVLFDLPARKFHILGLTLWPQDFVYLSLLLIVAGLSLFFFTALAGRLWCGFACPQTVWTETFLMIERWVEGDRSKRMKLDKSPWNANKIIRKSSKQFLWIVFAAWTGFTFVGFFTPIRELGGDIVNLELGGWGTFWIIFYSFATYGNAGFLREQVCKYMCPYARFQSAMFDQDTLIISYDLRRGEPRGGRRKSADPAELKLGSCIDCTLCVQVCPTGIDIRDGLQYECIACAACIDVCDQVMDKMEYPRGLISFTTEHALQGEETHVLRPRMWIYGYRELPGGIIESVYMLKITNMDNKPHRYELTVLDNDVVEFDFSRPLELQAEEVADFSMRIRMPASAGSGTQSLELRFQAVDDPSIQRLAKARMLLPTQTKRAGQ
jgi:cytochrome c oxidase accessory protein FixG